MKTLKRTSELSVKEEDGFSEKYSRDELHFRQVIVSTHMGLSMAVRWWCMSIYHHEK